MALCSMLFADRIRFTQDDAAAPRQTVPRRGSNIGARSCRAKG
jgi:hypothetical protein